MSQPPPLSEQERADLVAYLDGELEGLLIGDVPAG